MRLIYLLVLAIVVGLLLEIRSWWDARREKKLDIEIVRDGEEFLGSWASKSKEALIIFRLKRDASIVYKQVMYPAGDTMTWRGSFSIVWPGNGRSTNNYPRLIATDEKNDTLLNFYIAYLTPYGSTIDDVDRMVLQQRNLFDTMSITFYRIKQE